MESISETPSNLAMSYPGSANVAYTLEVVRKPHYDTASIVIPIYIISIMACLSFLMPTTFPGRVAYVVTLQLSLRTIGIVIKGQVAPSGDFPEPKIFQFMQYVTYLSLGSLIYSVFFMHHTRNGKIAIQGWLVDLIICRRFRRWRKKKTGIEGVDIGDKLMVSHRVRISSTFSVLRPFSYLRPFLYFDPPTLVSPKLYFDLNFTSTFLAKLYFGLNFSSTFLTKLYFGLNFTSTFLAKLYFGLRLAYFDLFTSTKTVLRPVFSTNKKPRFYKRSKYRSRSKADEVERSKYRKGRRYENGRSTEKVELMRTHKIAISISYNL